MKEKRKARAYKIADKPYLAAMKRASKNKKPLASLIEYFVTSYGEGYDFLRSAKGETFKENLNPVVRKITNK